MSKLAIVPDRLRRFRVKLRRLYGRPKHPEETKETQKLNSLLKLNRYTPGNINIFDWDLDYVDARGLWSCLDVIVLKKWNDYQSKVHTPLIVDCGANIGISVLNYKRLYPDAHILAIEPDPHIIPVLKRNLSVNSVTDVDVIEAAAWIEDGHTSFYCEGSDGSRIVNESTPEGERTTVKTIDLSSLLSEQVDLLKIDIEGAEFAVIPHIQDRLDGINNLVMECHVNNDDIAPFAETLQTLAATDFTITVNSYGAWRDLVHMPKKLAHEFDQYFLVTATRT